ncbi:hypothetical protein [Planobispora longispora]|nr:hypothetical protein [Planobispora longispora]
MHDVDRLVAGIAPDPGPGMTPGARELFDEITAVAPAPRRRRFTAPFRAGTVRRRRWTTLPIVVASAAMGMLVTWMLPGSLGPLPASAALDVKRDGDYYVVTVKDLFADPELYESELKARGINISLHVAPTSRSQTGSILLLQDVDLLKAGKPVPVDGPIETIEAPGRCRSFGGCPIGLKVPVDFTKRAEITLGREAGPGERYQIPPAIGMPGEPLHCVEYANRTVAEITAVLRERGVEAEFTSFASPDQPIPGNWYVHDGVMSMADRALLLAGPEPNPAPRPVETFCPKGS